MSALKKSYSIFFVDVRVRDIDKSLFSKRSKLNCEMKVPVAKFGPISTVWWNL